MIIKTEGINQNTDSSSTITFIAETANEGMSLERFRRSIRLSSPISKYTFVIGKDNTVVLTISIYELVKFMGGMK